MKRSGNAVCSEGAEVEDIAIAIAGCLGVIRQPLRPSEIYRVLQEGLSQQKKKSIRAEIYRILREESHRRKGLFKKSSSGRYDLSLRISLRRRMIAQLKKQGFSFHPSQGLIKQEIPDKETLRRIHYGARRDRFESLTRLVEGKEKQMIQDFANGKDVDTEAFEPYFEVVQPGSPQSDLFRYASLLWSVPVSDGFGRRTKFIVKDKHNDKIVGIFALGDPVFNLRCRDAWIGWSSEDRAERLYNVMDIFVLGAVPPYNSLLGGKLIALMATSNEVRDTIRRKYEKESTLIQGKKKDPVLALLTTGSALGKSSIYDRIKYGENLLYHRIGVSEGWGHFQFNHVLFQDMRDLVAFDDPVGSRSNRFGQGPNWKMRISRMTLERLGLPSNLLRHGVSREIYGIPLASNFKEFLIGKEGKLNQTNLPISDLVEYFKVRWMNGRASRRPEYRSFERNRIPSMIRAFEDRSSQIGKRCA